MAALPALISYRLAKNGRWLPVTPKLFFHAHRVKRQTPGTHVQVADRPRFVARGGAKMFFFALLAVYLGSNALWRL